MKLEVWKDNGMHYVMNNVGFIKFEEHSVVILDETYKRIGSEMLERVRTHHTHEVVTKIELDGQTKYERVEEL